MRQRLVGLAWVFVIVFFPHVRAATPASPSPTATSFELIKKLAGEWRTSPGNNQMTNIVWPIASGTAVLHEKWKGGEQLTAWVFYLGGDELRADHTPANPHLDFVRHVGEPRR